MQLARERIVIVEIRKHALSDAKRLVLRNVSDLSSAESRPTEELTRLLLSGLEGQLMHAIVTVLPSCST